MERVTFEIDGDLGSVRGNQRDNWEFMLKMKYFTSDLYIADMLKLVSDRTSRRFDHDSGMAFGLDYAYVVATKESIEPAVTFTKDMLGTLKEKKLVLENITAFGANAGLVFPLNFAILPASTTNVDNTVHDLIIFKVALGKSLAISDRNQVYDMPEHYDSVVYTSNISELDPDLASIFEQTKSDENELPFCFNADTHALSTAASNATIVQNWVKVKFPELQILPLYLCTVDFRAVRVLTSLPICDGCQFASATIYCPADKSHFCETCDTTHHSSSQIVASHRRTSVGQSPHVFGNCDEHPTAVIDSVCEGCNKILCSFCLLLGDHAKEVNSREHQLVTPFDAYMSGIAQSNPCIATVRDVRLTIYDKLKQLKSSMTQSIRNFTSISSKLENIERDCANKISKLYMSSRMGFLVSLRKQYLLELLLIANIEDFWNHVQATLPPGNYIQMNKKLMRLIYLWFRHTNVSSMKSEELDLNINSYCYPPGLYQSPTTDSLVALHHEWRGFSSGYHEIDSDIRITGALHIISSLTEKTDERLQTDGIGAQRSKAEDERFLRKITSTHYEHVDANDLDELVELGALECRNDNLCLNSTKEASQGTPDSSMNVFEAVVPARERLLQVIWDALRPNRFLLVRKILYGNRNLQLHQKFELIGPLIDLAIYHRNADQLYESILTMTFYNLLKKRNDTVVARDVSTVYDSENIDYVSQLNLRVLVDPVLIEAVGHVIDSTKFLGSGPLNRLLDSDIKETIPILVPFIIQTAGYIQDLLNDAEIMRLPDSELQEKFEKAAELSLYNFVAALTSKKTNIDSLPNFIRNLVLLCCKAFDNLVSLSDRSLLSSFYPENDKEPTRVHALPARLLKNAPISLSLYLIVSCYYSRIVKSIGIELAEIGHTDLSTDAISIACRHFSKQLHILARVSFIDAMCHKDELRPGKRRNMFDEVEPKSLLTKCSRDTVRWGFRNLFTFDGDTPLKPALAESSRVIYTIASSSCSVWSEYLSALHAQSIQDVYDDDFCVSVLSEAERYQLERLDLYVTSDEKPDNLDIAKPSSHPLSNPGSPSNALFSPNGDEPHTSGNRLLNFAINNFEDSLV